MADYLFVYGTLRKEVGHPMHRVLIRHAILVDKGVYQGELYDLGDFPAAIHSARLEDRVHGEIYQLKGKDQIFEILDRYEGCVGTAPYFRRERKEVRSGGGKVVCVWLYLYNRPVERYPRIPGGDYLTLLRGSARQAPS